MKCSALVWGPSPRSLLSSFSRNSPETPPHSFRDSTFLTFTLCTDLALLIMPISVLTCNSDKNVFQTSLLWSITLLLVLSHWKCCPISTSIDSFLRSAYKVTTGNCNRLDRIAATRGRIEEGMASLKGKVALVTGGSRGIGKEIALVLAGAGAAVVVNYAGNEAAANETVSQITATGAKAIAVKGDVSKAADVLAAFDKSVEAFGAVHIVVHVAGILLDNYPLIVDTTEEEWDRIFTTNAKGTFLVVKEAAKRLGPGGRIITTSSSLVGTLLPRYGSYSASKGAVEVLTKTLARELKGRKITVNCVAPGAVATEMFFRGKTQEQIDFVTKQPPLERLGEPKDIAALTLFLASDASEWVNGQVIRVNGGLV